MKNIFRNAGVWTAAAVCLVVSGCAKTGSLPEDSSTRTVQIAGMDGSLKINASNNAATATTVSALLEKVWAALPAVFDSLSVPFSRLDKASHIIGNDALKIRQRLGKAPLSRYLDCGQTQIGPNADSYDVTLTMLVQLQPGANGTTVVNTSLGAVAKPITFAQAASACSSKGTLEKRFSTLLDAQLLR